MFLIFFAEWDLQRWLPYRIRNREKKERTELPKRTLQQQGVRLGGIMVQGSSFTLLSGGCILPETLSVAQAVPPPDESLMRPTSDGS